MQSSDSYTRERVEQCQFKKEYEVGTDLRFFDNKIKLGYSYYYNKTEDVFFNLSLANSSGYDEIFTNAGEIENKGFELSISSVNIDKEDFVWSTSISLSQNKIFDKLMVKKTNEK